MNWLFYAIIAGVAVLAAATLASRRFGGRDQGTGEHTSHRHAGSGGSPAGAS
jgi:hypothetical protein